MVDPNCYYCHIYQLPPLFIFGVCSNDDELHSPAVESETNLYCKVILYMGLKCGHLLYDNTFVGT